MIKVEKGIVPIKMWLKDIEEGALTQAKNLTELPFIFKHVALMPDAHQGYGMPIGGVIATKGVIIPNAVGVDIGCGVCALKTSIKALKKDQLIEIVAEIKKRIPMGFNKYEKPEMPHMMPTTKGIYALTPMYSVIAEHLENARLQLGTLGGGNHFIEIQKGDDDHIWVMLHSGSRNLGKQVADFHNRRAIELNESWHSAGKKETQLAFLPLSTPEGMHYMEEMNYCVDYASQNRMLMMQIITECISKITKVNVVAFEPKPFGKNIINIAHNYATMEEHYNHQVIVHRKGATSAKKDEIGIIPGSQGTASYIVKGKGAIASFMSCSHGAGRTMSRTDAKKILDFKEQVKIMDDQDIVHNMKSIKDIDEAPGAYKDIEVVMENQKDLVEIVHKMIPLAVIKA